MRKFLSATLIVLALILPNGAFAAIALDTTAAGTRVTTTTSTLSYTVGATANARLFVGVNVDQTVNLEQVTSVTYNGVAMNLVGGVVISTGGVGNVYLYELAIAAPDGAAHNIVSTKNGSVSGQRIFAVSYNGVSQGALDSSNTDGPVSQVNLTQTLTLGSNAWMVVYNTNSAGDPTAGTNNTQRQNGTGFGVYLGDSNGPNTGSFAMTTNHVGTNTWGGIAASFTPVADTAVVSPTYQQTMSW